MTIHRAIPLGIFALAVGSLACERAEPTHNSGHQATDKPSSPTTLQRVEPQIDKQRNNAGARAGLPRPSDDDADATDAPSTPPSTATSDTKQSAGPSAAGRTQTSPADEARKPVQ